MSLSAVLFFANSAIEVFLEVSGFHAHSVVVFVIASDGLKILAGIGLVVCLLFNFNSFFRMVRSLRYSFMLNSDFSCQIRSCHFSIQTFSGSF